MIQRGALASAPLLIAALLASSCSGPGLLPGPPEFELLDVGTLSGRYRVTLTLSSESPTPRTCGQLEVTFGAQVTWQALDCALREGPGARDVADGNITLRDTVDVAGGESTPRQAYFFFVFGGTATRPTSAWFGPACAPPGGLPPCNRESGTAEWVRQ